MKAERLTGTALSVRLDLLTMTTTRRKRRPTKGHWPHGKRRHDLPGWPTTLSTLAVIVSERMSRRSVSEHVGVSERTIRRWLAGEDIPSPAHAARVRAFIRHLMGTERYNGPDMRLASRVSGRSR